MEGEEDGRRISKKHVAGFAIPLVPLILILLGFPTASRGESDYRGALSKSLLYFEAQRSGRLPHDQRVAWRGNSGLTDGLEQGVDLVGGYYDAGDNIKFGLPMAFTITMLSWSLVEYRDGVAAAGELKHALEAIKWGTDYFIKAHTRPNVFWAQVAIADTSCDSFGFRWRWTSDHLLLGSGRRW
ncbi:hypothetical protein BHE74_00029019 [Ensete ventricosum]|nr:hypothetical protein GW17_00021236 [Ensete ventricosum]RWW63785.1 hypothetical protein BHE74_00029019 [Ensete ventricosum]RZS00206.1 hypothetical protein BHM03_00029868 [Ensete ventricosum]